MPPTGSETRQISTQAYFGRYLTSVRAMSTRRYATKPSSTATTGISAAHGISLEFMALAYTATTATGQPARSISARAAHPPAGRPVVATTTS